VLNGSPSVIAENDLSSLLRCRHRMRGQLLYRQDMAPGRTLAGELTGRGQHLTMADRAVVEEATECERLVAVFSQSTDVRRRLLRHRFQQTRTPATQSRITKATQARALASLAVRWMIGFRTIQRPPLQPESEFSHAV
jgi:hypothetical protein